MDILLNAETTGLIFTIQFFINIAIIYYLFRIHRQFKSLNKRFDEYVDILMEVTHTKEQKEYDENVQRGAEFLQKLKPKENLRRIEEPEEYPEEEEKYPSEFTYPITSKKIVRKIKGRQRKKVEINIPTIQRRPREPPEEMRIAPPSPPAIDQRTCNHKFKKDKTNDKWVCAICGYVW